MVESKTDRCLRLPEKPENLRYLSYLCRIYIDRVARGLSLSQVGKLHGVNKSTVYRIVIRLEDRRGHPALETILRYYCKGDEYENMGGI